jgi:hypothetical protein
MRTKVCAEKARIEKLAKPSYPQRGSHDQNNAEFFP